MSTSLLAAPTTLAAAGSEGWVTAFETSWNSGAMWTELTAFAGLVGLVVVFAFGYRLVRRLISGVAKGKAKI